MILTLEIKTSITQKVQASYESNKLSSMCKLNHRQLISRKVYKQNATVDRSRIQPTYENNRTFKSTSLLFSFLLTLNRDLKIRRRRRQRELQINNRLRLAKQQLCTCITLFCTFLWRHCTTTMRKCLISRFMEDVNKLL